MIMNRENKASVRVLQYVRVLDNGGIERLIFSLLENTNRNVVNYDFLLTRNKKEAYDKELYLFDSRKIVVIPKQSKFLPIRYFYIYQAMYNYFKQCEYKIVHFQSVGTSLGGSIAIFAAKQANIPVRIVHAHSAAGEARNILRRIDSMFGRITHMKWGTHFIACSEDAALYSFGKKNLKKVKILNNGININKFAFNFLYREAIRKELNINHKFVLGSIGRLSEQKNHKFMIDVLEHVLKTRKDAVLVLVGSYSTNHDGYIEQIKNYISEKELVEYVIWTGEREDAFKVMNAFDAYLFPSLWEGLGIAAIEAQANGLPVFASDTVPKEAKITNSFTFISLEKGANFWADEILKYPYELPRKNVSKQIIEAGYDIKTSAKKMEDFYIDLAREVNYENIS